MAVIRGRDKEFYIKLLTLTKYPQTTIFDEDHLDPSYRHRFNNPNQEEYDKEATAYFDELSAKSEEEIQKIAKQLTDAASKKAEEAKKQEDLNRFYHQPEANADFSHWCKASYWTLEEAIALSFGKCPKEVEWKTISYHEDESDFVKKYADRRELARRAVNWKQLYDPVMPGVFIAWLKRYNMDFPSALETEVIANGGHVGDWKTAYDDLKKSHDDLNAKYSALLSERKDDLKTTGDYLKKSHEDWKATYETLEKLYNNLKAKYDGLLSTREKEKNSESAPTGYTTPYLDLMNKMIAEYGDKLKDVKKGEIEEWLRENAPENFPASDRVIESMAMFLRPVEAREGRKRKLKQGATHNIKNKKIA